MSLTKAFSSPLEVSGGKQPIGTAEGREKRKCCDSQEEDSQHPLPAHRVRGGVPAAPNAESPEAGGDKETKAKVMAQAGHSQVRTIGSLPLLLLQSPTPQKLDLENQWELSD